MSNAARSVRSASDHDLEQNHVGSEMRVVVFGANGRIGSAIVKEATGRGHAVTAAVRSPDKIDFTHPRLSTSEAYIDDAASVQIAVRGHNAVVNSVGGLGHENPRISIQCMKPLVEGLRAAGVQRLIVVGTAGTLEVPGGGLRKDQPDFPAELRVEAQAQAEVLEFLRGIPPGELKWTYISPPALIEAGERTGRIRLGRDQLLFDSEGKSYISNEDFAIATLEELEQPQHIGLRFTAISY